MTFEQGLDSIQATLDELEEHLIAEKDKFIGYPCNADFNYEALYRFLAYPINNIGDPYDPSNYHLNTHRFELEVLKFFEEITQAQQEKHGVSPMAAQRETITAYFWPGRSCLMASSTTHKKPLLRGKILRCLNLPAS